MAFTQNQSAVAELYIAALGRPSEKAGLDYWVGRLEGTITGEAQLAIEEIQAKFFDPLTSSEVEANFPAGQSNTDYIEAIYLNVFERSSDAGGKVYWEGRIAEDGKAAVLAEMLVVAKQSTNDALTLSTNLAEAQSQYDAEAALLPPVVEESPLQNGFTTELLDGLTLYNVFTDDAGGILNNTATFTFAENTYTASDGLINTQTYSGTYSILTPEILYMSPIDVDDDMNYIIMTEDRQDINGFEANWADSFDSALGVTVGNEYFFLDQASAELFIA